MIVRDLYRCPSDDLHKAMASSSQTVLRRGIIEPASAIEPGDVDYLVAHPDFDPSMSFVAYDGGQPAAFLVSRIEGPPERRTAVWSLYGGRAEAPRAMEIVLADATDHWRSEGATRACKGLTGLLGSEPRVAEDAQVIDFLKQKDFDIKAASAELALDLRKLPTPPGAAEREAELKSKGYVVRQARADEVAVIARQYHPRRTGWLGQELWNLLFLRLRPEGLLVMDHRRDLIGYAAFFDWTLDGECPALGPVYVEEVHRKTGLGGILLRGALAAMKEAGKARVKVNCGPERVGFFERAGFAVTGRFCREAVAELD